MKSRKGRDWKDPVKGKPADKATLEVKGDFREFTDLMRRVVRKREDPKTVPASRVPGAS